LKGFSATIQLSKVAAVYTDAENTEVSNAQGTIGKLPAYQVMDAALTYKFLKYYNVKAGINNLTDEKYASRRATGYPGPGILPGNGRTYFLSLGATF
jgi:Fe(3+) dicitrate transport protein